LAQRALVLLNPPYIEEVYDFDQEFSVEYPLGLAFLAGTLERDGLPYEILDANALGFSTDHTVEEVARMAPDVLGITSTTTTIVMVSRLAERLKARLPGLVVVLGGPHATAAPDRTLREFPVFDYVVQGDGELLLAELMHVLNDGLEPHQAPARFAPAVGRGGVWYRDGDACRQVQTLRQFASLDDIPFPSRRKLPNVRYNIGPLMNQGYSGAKLVKLAASRGCPYACNFCSEGQHWPAYRYRTPENVFKEIEVNYHRDGARHFYFVDDTINVRTKDLFKLCNMIVDSGMKIRWHCHARVHPIDDEILSAMRASGCFGIMFGVESGDPTLIKGLGKNITVEHVRKAVRLAKQHNMKVLTFFMFGHIGDTPETCQRTIDFACELNPDVAFFSMATPYPGTAMYDHYIATGVLPKDFRWNQFKVHQKDALHDTATMTGEQIWRFYNRAHFAFYLRPRYAGRVAKRLLHNPREIRDYWWMLRESVHLLDWIPSPINPGSSARA
jgi:anaerobic magnesium-protoporphyrin IX monomethyl ester cyclase